MRGPYPKNEVFYFGWCGRKSFYRILSSLLAALFTCVVLCMQRGWLCVELALTVLRWLRRDVYVHVGACVCVCVCGYVSMIKRKPVIAMTWYFWHNIVVLGIMSKPI